VGHLSLPHAVIKAEEDKAILQTNIVGACEAIEHSSEQLQLSIDDEVPVPHVLHESYFLL
jgi:hypothetical protein